MEVPRVKGSVKNEAKKLNVSLPSDVIPSRCLHYAIMFFLLYPRSIFHHISYVVSR